ncbi:retrotransposon protein [Striga asiatica]|uniref:Retrotransposon protein n=1 Tax=Striga asiatica TaxID=4170 RepID=A0A5A7PMI3_STRAF|nr:retrotransposon protein [Striga asiatica]
MSGAVDERSSGSVVRPKNLLGKRSRGKCLEHFTIRHQRSFEKSKALILSRFSKVAEPQEKRWLSIDLKTITCMIDMKNFDVFLSMDLMSKYPADVQCHDPKAEIPWKRAMKRQQNKGSRGFLEIEVGNETRKTSPEDVSFENHHTAPVVSVEEKDGPMTMCIDYCGLNRLMIDWRFGYHQLKVKESDVSKTRPLSLRISFINAINSHILQRFKE